VTRVPKVLKVFGVLRIAAFKESENNVEFQTPCTSLTPATLGTLGTLGTLNLNNKRNYRFSINRIITELCLIPLMR